MKKYVDVINIIDKKETWQNDQDFLIDNIIKATIQLLYYCYEDLEDYKIMRIFPILRQVQENCLILLSSFFNVNIIPYYEGKKHSPKDIVKDIYDNTQNEKDREQIAFASDWLQGIKNILSDYTHTSFEGIFQLSMENFHIKDVQEFNKVNADMLCCSLEMIFDLMIKERYGIKYPTDRLNQWQATFKNINWNKLKYIKLSLPNKMQSFITSSELMNNKFKALSYTYRNAFESLLKLVKEKHNI